MKTEKYLLAFVRMEGDRVHYDFEMRKFPVANLATAKKLIDDEIDKAILKGPTDD